MGKKGVGLFLPEHSKNIVEHQKPRSSKLGACACAPPQLGTHCWEPLWLHRTTHQGTLTSYPSRFSVAEPLPNQEHATKNVLPERGFSLRTPHIQLERYRVGELSLSGEPECLSLHAQDSTLVRKTQQGAPKSKEGGVSSPCMNTRDSTPHDVEVLESRRQLRLNVNELIRLANNSTITTGEMQQQLFLGVIRFGAQLATQLVRSLHRDDPQERQSIVWLLTLLNDKETITPLRHMSHDKHIPRSIRLSASLALAGMGVTAETIDNHRRTRLYAIS